MLERHCAAFPRRMRESGHKQKPEAPEIIVPGLYFFISDYMEDINKLEQERKELNTLINKGVSFEVKDIEFETHKRFFGLVKKRVPKEVTRTYKIEEVTLSTLDRLSAEWIEFAIDETLMKSADGMKRARGLQRNTRCVVQESLLLPYWAKIG